MASESHKKQNPAKVNEDLQLRSVSMSVLYPGVSCLQIKDVAKVLGCSSHQVRDLISEGRLAAFNIADKSPRNYYRIPTSAVEEFIKLNKTV